MTENKKQNKGTLVFDIDGTLCPIKTKEQAYSELEPYHEMVDKLREYQAQGFNILLYTARNMKTHQCNMGLINKHTAPVLLDWLHKWDIPYDEVLFGKPWPGEGGFYVDDRSVRPREFLSMSEEELNELIDRDRAFS